MRTLNSVTLRCEGAAVLLSATALAAPAPLDKLLDDERQGIRINFAYAINDRGQIAAVSSNEGSILAPLLLTPRRCRYR
jgi:HEAT repeat protein